MQVSVHKNDLPAEFLNGLDSVAVDTETMGLCPNRDRLCVAQFSSGNGECHLIQFYNYTDASNIKKLLADRRILKIFHYARFDVMMFYKYLGTMTENVYCTKIASKLTRTYAQKHSLMELCRDLLRIEISKEQTCTDWGKEQLSEQQKEYAACDVLHLHKLKQVLDALLERENRTCLAIKCFDFLKARVMLDLMVGERYDIFSHES
ncbi:MAG: ribonuclease D [Holosporales bacterium]|jgi:ribonuclease D|nr:ribonuclease D [Holosporales bacterium]